LEILAARMEIPSVKLAEFDFSAEITHILPKEICLQLRLIPLEQIGNKLHIAMINPNDLKAIDIVQFKTGCEVTAFMATENDVFECIERVYRLSKVSKDSMVQSIEKMFEAQKQLIEIHEKSLVQHRIVLTSLQEMLFVARKK
jgi:type IV pilus assembly protein PilB